MLPLLAAAAPYVLGAASAAGQASTNRQNRNMAREQMRFQERMSSTSVQRAVEDYRAAGLNPALAYGHSASSPGGASTTIGDPISAGITSGQAAKSALDSYKANSLQRELMLYQKRKLGAEIAATEQSTSESAARERLTNMQNATQTLLQPHTVRLAASQALMAALSIPGQQVKSDVSSLIAAFSKHLPNLGTSANQGLAQLLRYLNPQTGGFGPSALDTMLKLKP